MHPVTIFLATDSPFDAVARQELLVGFKIVGSLHDLPQGNRNDAALIVQKANDRGARAIIAMAGTQSPFGMQLKSWAREKKIKAVFVLPVAPANQTGFAESFRQAQRELLNAFLEEIDLDKTKAAPSKEATS